MHIMYRLLEWAAARKAAISKRLHDYAQPRSLAYVTVSRTTLRCLQGDERIG